MEHHKIECDSCGKDLTTSGNSVDWRLTLRPERIPPAGGFCTDMMIYPALDRAYHFCHMGCLEAWQAKKEQRDA